MEFLQPHPDMEVSPAPTLKPDLEVELPVPEHGSERWERGLLAASVAATVLVGGEGFMFLRNQELFGMVPATAEGMVIFRSFESVLAGLGALFSYNGDYPTVRK